MRPDRSPDGATSVPAWVTVAVAVLAVFAGCSGAVGNSTPARISGTAVTAPPAAVDDAGFERVGTTERTINATLRAELQGDIAVTEVLDVVATVPVSRYRRPTPDGPTVVALAASPSVQLIEHPPMSRDPLSTLSTAELAGFVQSTYANVSVGPETRSRSVTVFGNETTLDTYRARARSNGVRRPVDVYVARVDHRGDVVTIVAVAPRETAIGDRLSALLTDLSH